MATNNTIATNNISLPKDLAKEIATKARNYSVIQALSPAEPLLFRDIDHIVFDEEPEAEFVAEGSNKAPSEVSLKTVSAGIHKAHVTLRTSDEVIALDEDNQVGLVDSLIESGAAALGRALDYGVFHAVNPLPGTALSGATALTAGAETVTKTSDTLADLDSLVDAVNENYEINGLGLSRTWANELRHLRADGTGMRLFPEIPLNLNVGSVDGIAAAVSNTVNGARANTETGVLAILGDYSKIKWGIVRDLGLDVITMGDPDGKGDLKRKNQVAWRLEVYYSWAVLDPKAFAVLKAASGN